MGAARATRAVHCATRSRATLASGRCATRSTRHGKSSLLRRQHRPPPGRLVINLKKIFSRVRCSLWAEKDYVDPKRIGIWGWVRRLVPPLLFGFCSFSELIATHAVLWRFHERKGGRGRCGHPLISDVCRCTSRPHHFFFAAVTVRSMEACVLFNCFSENPLSSLSRAGACTVRFYFLRHQRLSSRFTHSSPPPLF